MDVVLQKQLHCICVHLHCLHTYVDLMIIVLSKTKKSLRYTIEKKWKEKRDWLIRNGSNDKYLWAKCGNTVIQNMISQNERSREFDVRHKDLTLICLF